MRFENNLSRKNAPHERGEGNEGGRPGGSGRGVARGMNVVVEKTTARGRRRFPVHWATLLYATLPGWASAIPGPWTVLEDVFSSGLTN
jgi:hypothetical protein